MSLENFGKPCTDTPSENANANIKYMFNRLQEYEREQKFVQGALAQEVSKVRGGLAQEMMLRRDLEKKVARLEQDYVAKKMRV